MDWENYRKNDLSTSCGLIGARGFIADNDQDFAESAAELQGICGVIVEMALSKEITANLVNRNTSSIVFMDIGMPDQNGFQTVAEMNKSLPAAR